MITDAEKKQIFKNLNWQKNISYDDSYSMADRVYAMQCVSVCLQELKKNGIKVGSNLGGDYVERKK